MSSSVAVVDHFCHQLPLRFHFSHQTMGPCVPLYLYFLCPIPFGCIPLVQAYLIPIVINEKQPLGLEIDFSHLTQDAAAPVEGLGSSRTCIRFHFMGLSVGKHRRKLLPQNFKGYMTRLTTRTSTSLLLRSLATGEESKQRNHSVPLIIGAVWPIQPCTLNWSN